MKLKVFFLIAILSLMANVSQAIRIEKEWIIFTNKTDNVSVATNSWTNGWLWVRDMAIGDATIHGKQAMNWDTVTKLFIGTNDSRGVGVGSYGGMIVPGII